jgi:acyl carrier protein
MIISELGQNQRSSSRYKSRVDIEKLRGVIAKFLDVDIIRVTDDAHLYRDLGADWLDRLELIILVEETAGVQITDDEADRVEVVGDLILYVDDAGSIPPRFL